MMTVAKRASLYPEETENNKSDDMGAQSHYQHHLQHKQRGKHQLDSFDSYIVVSVLTATASFEALFEGASEDGTEIEHTPFSSVMHALFVVLCSISSLSGIYATVVFSFCSIYGRTAVGAGRYTVYKEFLHATGVIRHRAFLMYLLSLISFLALLVATATERIEKKYRYPFCATFLVLSIFSYRDWNHILKCAGPIFAPEKGTGEKEHKLLDVDDGNEKNNKNIEGSMSPSYQNDNTTTEKDVRVRQPSSTFYLGL